MSTEILAALLIFNGWVAMARDRIAPESRIFVGLQPGPEGESGARAWTKCVPGSGVFVTQAAESLLEDDEALLRATAIHEVCHVRLHGAALCAAAKTGQSLPVVRLREMEMEADRCAAGFLGGAP